MTATTTEHPGLESVVAGETALSLVDGANGRLLYRGYRIGDLIEQGTYAQVAELLWTGRWPASGSLPPERIPHSVGVALREMPRDADPMDALRTALSVYATDLRLRWPPSVEQAHRLTAFAPSALAAFARIRASLPPIRPDPFLGLAAGFLYQLRGRRPDPATTRTLDAYLIAAAEHGFNASTFAARVITSTRSDMGSAVCGAIGALKGPLHGGAEAEVVAQLQEIGTSERAEPWARAKLAQGDRIMGFGHRVYRADDPRAAALRRVAESMARPPDWLARAVEVEDVVLRVLAETKPDRVLRTNVEYYAAAVLIGVGLEPDLFPATFALARMAGWTAHVLEQAATNRLIRPDARYVGPEEGDLPA
jgi:citrate synthase